MKFRGESIFNLFILLAMAWFLYGSLGFPSAARSFPLFVSAPGVALSGWAFANSLRKKPGDEEEVAAPEHSRRLYLVLVSLVGMVVAVMLVGLPVGLALFGFAFELFAARRSWMVAAAVGVFGFLLVWGLFGLLLHFPIYGGLLKILGS